MYTIYLFYYNVDIMDFNFRLIRMMAINLFYIYVYVYIVPWSARYPWKRFL